MLSEKLATSTWAEFKIIFYKCIIHFQFTEIVCNDEAFNISHSHDDDEKSEKKFTNFGQAGGCVLVDRKGRILYNYVCTDNTDWPDVEILLEQVILTLV